MLILSQNKKLATERLELSIESINRIMVESNSGSLYLLGEYATEERAKEVLQEIITKYKNWENMKIGQPNGLYLPVYEMPKE